MRKYIQEVIKVQTLLGFDVALPLTGCATLDKLQTSLSFSLLTGKLGILIIVELRWLNEFIHLKHLEQWLEQIKYSISISSPLLKVKSINL